MLQSPAAKGQKVKVGATGALRTLIRAAGATQHRNTKRAGYGLSLLEIRMASAYLRYLQSDMKGHNICPWTKVGERGLCGKSCCGTYCKVHRFKIRQGSKIPVPCKSCGRGVQSNIQLCRACGRDKVRCRHIALEKRARHQFSSVLAQLLLQYESPI